MFELLKKVKLAGSGLLLGALAGMVACAAEPPDPAAQAAEHIEVARTATGSDHPFLFSQLCGPAIEAVGAGPATGSVPPALPSTDPDPERDWYTDPVQVFDDLFYLGQTRYSAWGLRTSEGVIVVDAVFDYSAEDEILGGLERLGIDPAELRYVIISHAHGDHDGGAGILQQHGARIVMGEADWDLYESRGADSPRATRDIVATDGYEIRLGDHVVRTYLTPGHTHGTISTVFSVHDGGEEHVAAIWGGTAFNFRDSPDDPRQERLVDYAESARRFRDITTAAGADIMLSNHPTYDGSTAKIPMLAQRGPGAPHPFVIGQASVSRYLDVAENCAVAARITENELVL